MKSKVFAFILIATLSLSLTACSGNSDELEELKKENAELKEEIKELKEGSSSDDDSDSSNSTLAEMKVNEPFLIETDKGDYTVTILQARKTDWWQRSNNGDTSKTIIALAYEVENIDFKTGQTTYDGRDGVLVDSSAFRVSDENGYILDMDNSSFSDYGYPEIVEVGYKSKEELPYIVDGDTSYLDVVFYRSTGDVAEIRIDVTE